MKSKIVTAILALLLVAVLVLWSGPILELLKDVALSTTVARMFQLGLVLVSDLLARSFFFTAERAFNTEAKRGFPDNDQAFYTTLILMWGAMLIVADTIMVAMFVLLCMTVVLPFGLTDYEYRVILATIVSAGIALRYFRMGVRA